MSSYKRLLIQYGLVYNWMTNQWFDPVSKQMLNTEEQAYSFMAESIKRECLQAEETLKKELNPF